MTQEQAVSKASAATSHFEIPPDYQFASARMAIIEVFGDGRAVRDEIAKPGPVWDRVAWLVTFAYGAWAAELAVDNQTGSIIRVRHFRGAPDQE